MATMTAARQRLLIELDASTDPVRGTIGPEAGPVETFDGYVQLIAALERARDAADMADRKG